MMFRLPTLMHISVLFPMLHNTNQKQAAQISAHDAYAFHPQTWVRRKYKAATFSMSFILSP